MALLPALALLLLPRASAGPDRSVWPNAESRANSQRLAAQGDAEIQSLQTEAEIRRLRERERTAQAYSKHPALLRLRELETLSDLSRNATARIYIGFDKHSIPHGDSDSE